MYDIDVSVYCLLKKLKDECITNHNHYLPCMVRGKKWFYNQMHSFIMHKTVYSSFCGLLPYIMANASNENIIIIEKIASGHSVLNVSPLAGGDMEQTGPQSVNCLYNAIVVYKVGYHYDACVHINAGRPDSSFGKLLSGTFSNLKSHTATQTFPYGYGVSDSCVSSLNEEFSLNSIVYVDENDEKLDDTSVSIRSLDASHENVNFCHSVDDTHDCSDMLNESVRDYLNHMKDYRIKNAKNCIIGH